MIVCCVLFQVKEAVLSEHFFHLTMFHLAIILLPMKSVQKFCLLLLSDKVRQNPKIM